MPGAPSSFIAIWFKVAVLGIQGVAPEIGAAIGWSAHSIAGGDRKARVFRSISWPDAGGVTTRQQ